MKLEEILDSWDRDSNIDQTELGRESLKIPLLHAKYVRWLANERLVCKKLKVELKQLELEKYEFYTQGPTKEQKDAGWILPARGMILKQEVSQYTSGDKDLINVSLKIGMAEEKVALLESIIWSLKDRTFALKNALDFLKFTSGG